MKPLKKLSARIIQFSSHPITSNKKGRALFRYISFQIISRIKYRLKYKWIHNLFFYVRKGDAGIVGNIYFGLYEYYESMFLLHFLRESDLFVDIGSNIGHYSLLASGIKNCQSIAIEPVPGTFKKLKENVYLNHLQDKIQMLNIGVGESYSELSFSTDKNTMNRIVTHDYRNSIKIPVKKMDSFLNLNFTSIMKIDVEGYEKFAFLGGVNTLKNENLKVVIAELNNSGRFYNVKDDEVYQLLLDFNFKPFSYDPKRRHLQKLESYNKDQFNTIFIRDFDFVKNRIESSEKIQVWDKSV